jgi:DNA-binding CsgD family transcriptional regulator
VVEEEVVKHLADGIPVLRVRALLRLSQQLSTNAPNSELFRTTLLNGLRVLFGAEIVSLHVARLNGDGRWDGEAREVGTTAWRTETAHAEYMRSSSTLQLSDPVMAAALEGIGAVCTRTRAEAVPMETWTRHPHRIEVRARAGIDESMTSVWRMGPTGDRIGVISVFYGAGSELPENDRDTLDLLHAELGPIIWNTLGAEPDRAVPPVDVHVRSLNPSSHDSPAARLTIAQRVVLPHLLGSMNEGEIAKAICRSRYTVHDHARAIYATLGVRNRLELVLKYKNLLDDPLILAASGRERSSI